MIFREVASGGKVIPPSQAIESKGYQNDYYKWKNRFFPLNTPYVIGPMTRKLNQLMWLLIFIISFRGRHDGLSHLAQKHVATPLVILSTNLVSWIIHFKFNRKSFLCSEMPELLQWSWKYFQKNTWKILTCLNFLRVILFTRTDQQELLFQVYVQYISLAYWLRIWKWDTMNNLSMLNIHAVL